MHEYKNQSFPEADSIVFTSYSRACPKYPKLQIYDIFAISQERGEVWSWETDKHQTILQVDVINLGGHGQACPNKFAKSFQHLKKEMRDEVDFLYRYAS